MGAPVRPNMLNMPKSASAPLSTSLHASPLPPLFRPLSCDIGALTRAVSSRRLQALGTLLSVRAGADGPRDAPRHSKRDVNTRERSVHDAIRYEMLF